MSAPQIKSGEWAGLLSGVPLVIKLILLASGVALSEWAGLLLSFGGLFPGPGVTVAKANTAHAKKFLQIRIPWLLP